MFKILFLFLTILSVGFASADQILFPDIRLELLKMEKSDQAARTGGTPRSEWASMDKMHVERIKEIIAEFGFPTISKVGNDGSNAAWLLIQHADHNPEFQREMLELMEPLARSGEINPRNYAYLYDRTHDPQRFGTQLTCVDGVWEPRRLEDPNRVNEFRETYGMQPLEQYVASIRMACEE